jgi:hypothetical protein
MAMSEESTREYTETMRGRYGRMTGRQARGRVIDEYVAVTGFERKYAIKVLRGGVPPKVDPLLMRVGGVVSVC